MWCVVGELDGTVVVVKALCWCRMALVGVLVGANANGRKSGLR